MRKPIESLRLAGVTSASSKLCVARSPPRAAVFSRVRSYQSVSGWAACEGSVMRPLPWLMLSLLMSPSTSHDAFGPAACGLMPMCSWMSPCFLLALPSLPVSSNHCRPRRRTHASGGRAAACEQCRRSGRTCGVVSASGFMNWKTGSSTYGREGARRKGG